MSPKYHINPETGNPNICRAKTPERCIYSTDDTVAEHFDSKDEARAAYEKQMNESFDDKLRGISSPVEIGEEIAPGLTAVVDLPMSSFAPTREIADRMENPEFYRMKEDFRNSLKDYLKLRNEGADHREILNAYDEYRYRRQLVEDYKNETARMLEKVSDTIPEHKSVVPDYAEKQGYAPSGSLEWLKLRQNTLGGSDVGAALAVGQWGEWNRRGFRESKTKEYTEGQEKDINTPTWRGNIWEDTVLKSAEKVLNEKIYTDKSTYSDGKRHANMDGLIPREDGSIKTIVEAKTSSHPEDWEGKIPEGYALQVQHYSDFFKSDNAYIAVNIDDERFKIFKVDEDYKVKAGDKTPAEFGEEFSYSDVREYAEKSVQSSRTMREKNAEKKDAESERRVFPDTPQDRDSWKRALSKGMVYADIETTGQYPSQGHIIEAAFVKTDGNGNEIARLHKYYGIPEKHEKWNGTGPEHIHKISPDEIRGKEVFVNSPSAQKEIQDFIGDSSIVAHNARFEKSWLEANGIKAEYADTMKAFGVSVKDEGIEDNTLESLVEWSGGKYEEAHRAINDTLMMKDTMRKLLPRIKNWLDEK